MGGIWGLATSTSLENLPVELRGVASGLLQEGYAFGNLVRRVMHPLSSMLTCPSFQARRRHLAQARAGGRPRLACAFLDCVGNQCLWRVPKVVVTRERGVLEGVSPSLFSFPLWPSLRSLSPFPFLHTVHPHPVARFPCFNPSLLSDSSYFARPMVRLLTNFRRRPVARPRLTVLFPRHKRRACSSARQRRC